MRWLGVVISSLVAISLTGLSAKALFAYVACLGLSIWFVRLFLINHYELDFEVLFKLFEWLGYGTPHRLDRISGTLYSTDGGNTLAEIPRPITQSLDRIISHILRDFVASWYNEVAKGDSFTEEAQRLLQMLSVDIYKRACDVDIQNVIEQIIFTFHVHLQRYNKSVTVVKGKDPNLKLAISSAELLCKTYESQVRKRHIALTNSAFELNYLRIVVDSLLAILIEQDDYRCNIGRFMLREILAMQTLKPLADLMTDPDWINEAVIAVLVEEPSSTGGHVEKVDTDTKPDQLSIKLQGSDIQCPVQTNFLVLSDNCNASKSTKLTDEQGLENHAEAKGNTELFEGGNIDVKVITEIDAHSEELKHELISTDSTTEPKKHSDENVMLEQNCANVSSSLSSSWSVVPPSKDQTFYSKSYEYLRDKLLQDEKGNSATFREFTRLGSCCHKFETSCEVDQQDGKNGRLITEGDSPDNAIRSSLSRSRSVPSCPEKLDAETECSVVAANRTHKSLSRSISVPTQLSSYKVTETSVPLTSHENILEYGSPFYSISFRSESDSYKTASSDDEFDEVEEVDESDDFVDESEVDVDVFAPNLVAPRHNGVGRLHKQLSFEEYVKLAKQPTEDSQNANNLSAANDHKDQNVTKGNQLVVGSCDTTQVQGSINHCIGLDTSSGRFYKGDYEEKFKRARLLQSSKSSGGSNSMANSSRDSDSFLGETLTSAKENWKKLVSSLRPFKFDLPSNTSSSSKSSDTTSEARCDASFDPSTREESSPSRRRLSRSVAVVDSDSDSESSYGTPREGFNVREEIVYGGQVFAHSNHVDGSDKGIVKIHPSQLVRIPATELLSEAGEEGPGRNKYTVYHIEYDIRIWPEVYQLAIYEARSSVDPEENGEAVEPSDEGTCQPVEELKKVDCKRIIKRRYREFMELHNRLVHGKHAKDMKAILKPNRKFNMPFGRLEPSVVEGRRTILQYYLVSLVSKPLLRESQELKEFLGVTGNGHVSFVKPSMAQMVSQSVYVPRVDKMLNRQVTKLIDKVKTAFDAVEEEEPSRPANKTVVATVDNGVPWRLCYSEEGEECDTKEQPTAENYFAIFIDCQDFQLEIRPPSPITQAQLNQAMTYRDPQDIGLDLPIGHLLVKPENGSPNEPPGGPSSDSTPDEEPAVEVTHGVRSSSILHVSEEPENSALDVDDEVKTHLSETKRPLGPSISLPPTRSPSMDKLHCPKLPRGRVSPTVLKDKLTSIASNEVDVTPQAVKGKLTSITSKVDVPPKTLKGKLTSLPPKEDLTPQALKGKLTSLATKGDVTPLGLKVKLTSLAPKEDVTTQALKGKLTSLAPKGDVTSQALKGKLTSLATKGDVTPQALKGKLTSLAPKGDVTPLALKGKLTSLATKGDVTPQALKGKLTSLPSKGDVTPQALKGKLTSLATKGDVTPQALKGKLSSLATKGDDAWDNIKDNLKIKQRQGDAWEAIRDNVKLVKHHGSHRELNPKVEEFDETTENFKSKQLNAWDNFKDNLKLKQKIMDLPKKKHNGELSTDESRGKQSTLPSNSHTNQSEESPLAHVIQGDVPLLRSSADRPSLQPTGLTEGVVNDEPQCPLANSIIALLCEILRGHNSWVCLDYVQHAFLGVFGGFFEWWLQGELDELVTEERWGYYLNLFDEAIWPNGELKSKQPEKSAKEKMKTKKEAIKTLVDFFPGVFRVAVGQSMYEESAVNIVESLQHPEINRLVFGMTSWGLEMLSTVRIICVSSTRCFTIGRFTPGTVSALEVECERQEMFLASALDFYFVVVGSKRPKSTSLKPHSSAHSDNT